MTGSQTVAPADADPSFSSCQLDSGLQRELPLRQSACRVLLDRLPDFFRASSSCSAATVGPVGYARQQDHLGRLPLKGFVREWKIRARASRVRGFNRQWDTAPQNLQNRQNRIRRSSAETAPMVSQVLKFCSGWCEGYDHAVRSARRLGAALVLARNSSTPVARTCPRAPARRAPTEPTSPGPRRSAPGLPSGSFPMPSGTGPAFRQASALSASGCSRETR